MTRLVRSYGACAILAIVLVSIGFGRALVAQEDISLREERAIQSAVAAVAPSVVRIETLGGLETVGGVLVGTGPTTGLVISPDGYIVSSAFNFVQKPTQTLVYLNDGTRLAATLVSTDFNRKLVLLKVDAKDLPIPATAPLKDIEVGQWAIAIGRTFGDGTRPNVSAGIISGKNRIWSKAIQTDAKISPGNYGGPLVDIGGRVIGVLAPFGARQCGYVGEARPKSPAWTGTTPGLGLPFQWST